MSAMHKLDSYYPNITDNGDDLKYKIDIYNYDESRICGFNKKGELLDVGSDIIFPSNLAELVREPCVECDHEMENSDWAVFCPDIIIELGDTPVITDKDEVTTDGNEEPNISIIPIYGNKTAEGSFDLTPEENEFRKKTYGKNHPVQYTRIHCTACNDHLGSALSEGSNIMVHPLLNVIICKGCYDFYTSGEFEKDYDGSETYCRWCGQGGLVICCSNCEFVFCTRCIRNNFGRKVLTRIRDSDEWTCFKCDHSLLTPLRVQCAELMEYIRRETARASTLENATTFINTDYSKCCKYTTEQRKKVKRRYSDDDKDYNPDAEQSSRPSSSSSSIKSVSSICNEANTAMVRKPITIAPKPVNSTKSLGNITQRSQNSTTLGVANSTNKTNVTFVSHPKPLVNKVNKPQTVSDVHGLPKNSSQIKVLPNGQRITIVKPRNFIPSTAGPRRTPIQKSALQPDQNNEQLKKRMCYESSVRAASRINSNLSCDLMNLRQEKMNARKLDDYVVVHNQLQEALNTSINSLIQLRKTLAVADLNNRSSVQKPLQQPSVPRQFHYIPDIVSNFFKTTPSTAWKNFNALDAPNCEKAAFVGIKEQKELEDTTDFKANAVNFVSVTGSACQGRPAAHVLVISDSETSVNSEGNVNLK